MVHGSTVHDISVLAACKKNNSDSESDSDEDPSSNLQDRLIQKLGLIIEKKFGKIVIQGENKPRRITRVDQVLDYSRVIADQDSREKKRELQKKEVERIENEKFFKRQKTKDLKNAEKQIADKYLMMDQLESGRFTPGLD